MRIKKVELPTVLQCRGPVGELSLEDVTMQLEPVWGPDDYWTTVWNSTYYSGDPSDGHPVPCVKTWLEIPAGQRVRWHITDGAVPPEVDRLVLETALWAYQHGLYASIGQRGGSYRPWKPRVCVELPLPEGEYPVQVWVDADRREAVRTVAYVVGARLTTR